MASDLKVGDKLCSGGTVTSRTYCGVKTPYGKVQLGVDGFLKVWNKRTIIAIEDNAVCVEWHTSAQETQLNELYGILILTMEQTTLRIYTSGLMSELKVEAKIQKPPLSFSQYVEKILLERKKEVSKHKNKAL